MAVLAQSFSTKGPAGRSDCAGRLFQSCVCMNNTVFLSFIEKNISNGFEIWKHATDILTSEKMPEGKYFVNIEKVKKRYINPLVRYNNEYKRIKDISEKIHNWQIIVKGSEGFNKAEVTCGGVDTAELSSKTMESKKVKGLYFIGEVVDVTGWLGGYNFQWAWSSGFAAGQFV